MKTFDFIITVNFFHDVESKSAHLFNYTYNEAFSVFSDLKLKYANSSYPFKEIVMLCKFPGEIDSQEETRVVSYLFFDFFNFDDDESAF